MNCSRKTKRVLNKIRIFILKAITYFAGFMFMCACASDPEHSDIKEVFIILVVSGGWLFLMGYANGWIYDTEPYYDRLEKEGDDFE